MSDIVERIAHAISNNGLRAALANARNEQTMAGHYDTATLLQMLEDLALTFDLKADLAMPPLPQKLLDSMREAKEEKP